MAFSDAASLREWPGTSLREGVEGELPITFDALVYRHGVLQFEITDDLDIKLPL